MKIIIGCERSQVVTNAFRELGHEAYSCDILDSEERSNYHIKDDILNHLDDGWDLAGFHPDCKNLAVSGARYFYLKKKEQKRDLDFVATLLNANIPKIYLENPVSIISSHIRKPDQIIQPWQFGHGETKATCLWLKNLPKLEPTNVVEGREHRVHKMPPGKNRGYLRARTYPGIAKAMAKQWGTKRGLITND